MELPEVTKSVKSSTQVILTLFISEMLPIFQGHFPKAPILPGVAMLNWAETFAREQFGITDEFIGVDNLKFQRVVSPSKTVTLQLTHKAEKQVVEFVFESDDERHASGKIKFQS
ncbi:3-hydroxyacyl-ACP dehydratase FabZ family protein [Corallincola platygyrae]|uniref:3-hydroxyacyl-ACP dehydratase FabZ family protein n=1 Tax=Corallincola platygyrae TaxID=1193278 RepID=A0ABW4XHX4_9GAMM